MELLIEKLSETSTRPDELSTVRVTVPGMTAAETFASGSVALVHDATDNATAANRASAARILQLKG